MRDSLHCPYILFPFQIIKIQSKSASIWHSHSSGITLQSFFLSPLFLLGPLFYPLWCPRKTWLKNKAGSGYPQIQLRAPSHVLPLSFMNSTDYKLEDKLLASSLKVVQGNDIFFQHHLFFYLFYFLFKDVIILPDPRQHRSWIFGGIRVKCTNGKKVYIEEKQYTAFLFYQL